MGVNRRTINRKVIYIMNGAVCYYLIGSQKVCSVGRAVGDPFTGVIRPMKQDSAIPANPMAGCLSFNAGEMRNI